MNQHIVERQSLYESKTCYTVSSIRSSYRRFDTIITGDVKIKVDSIWNSLWAGGVTNPLTVIEQLTYLMFIRSLDENEAENESFEAASGFSRPKIFPQTENGQMMRWSRFKDKDPRTTYDIVRNRVFPAIKNMRNGRLPDFDENGQMVDVPDDGDGFESAFSTYMKDASFEIPTPVVLQNIISGLDDLYEHDIKGLDIQGDLYEYMLGKISTAGVNGQFRTPKHIREMMVELIAPVPDDTICDPACGTAGFLISASEYIRKKYESLMASEQWDHFGSGLFTGFDTDKTMLRISTMNLMLHSIEHPDIRYCDSISKDNTESEKYTVCLANPPFKGKVNESLISESLDRVTHTKKTELLFVSLFLRMLKKGGRCACIVPDGVLFGSSKAHKALRRELVDNNKLVAIISMPSGVFKPYAGVSTAVMVFTKTGAGGTDNVWFYDMEADGFSLDDKRSPIQDSDIPDIIARFHDLSNEMGRERTEKSFMVPAEEIRENDYDLSINKYKKVVYEAVEYPPSIEIVKELRTLTDELSEDLRKLEEMLH